MEKIPKVYCFWNLQLYQNPNTSKPIEANIFINWNTVTIDVYKNSCHPFRGEKALNFISTLVLSFRCDSQINSESSNIPSRFVLSPSHIYYRKCIRFIYDRIMCCISTPLGEIHSIEWIRVQFFLNFLYIIWNRSDFVEATIKSTLFIQENICI